MQFVNQQPRARRAKCRFGNAAFSLFEVMMAVFVMAVVIISSITALEQGMRIIDTARYTTLAGQILQSQMEKIRLLTWAQLTDTTNGPVAFSTFTTDISSSTSAQLKRFTTTSGGAATFDQSIVSASSPFDTTMKIITLTATWSGIDGRSHQLQYVTYYGKNGISDFFYTTH